MVTTFVKVNDSGTLAGPATNIVLPRRGGVVTAVRTASGNLKLIGWGGQPLVRWGDSDDRAGAVTDIALD